MKISCIIPAHNEGGNIKELVLTLVSTLARHSETKNYEIIIINDNSTDNTGEIANALAKENDRIKVVHRSVEPKFGNALKTGFKHAMGEVIIPVMGDLSDESADVPKLVRKIFEGYDVAYGSRFIPGGAAEDYSILKLIFNRTYNHLVRLLFGIHHRDITNAFKAYRREVLDEIGIDNLKSSNFDICVEIPVRAHLLGFKSAEVPVRWHSRKRGEAKLKISKNAPFYGKRLLDLFILRISK